MFKGVVIKKISPIKDDRGWLSEVFRNDELKHQPAMAYFSETKPGVVRGPHEHVHQSDMFVFLVGTFVLYLWENRIGEPNYRQLEKIEVGTDNPCSVIIPPGVVHAYKCISKHPGQTINLPDRLYKGQGKTEEVDEVRWESMPDSPFVVD